MYHTLTFPMVCLVVAVTVAFVLSWLGPAHFNPAVTITFTVFRYLPWTKVHLHSINHLIFFFGNHSDRVMFFRCKIVLQKKTPELTFICMHAAAFLRDGSDWRLSACVLVSEWDHEATRGALLRDRSNDRTYKATVSDGVSWLLCPDDRHRHRGQRLSRACLLLSKRAISFRLSCCFITRVRCKELTECLVGDTCECRARQ